MASKFLIDYQLAEPDEARSGLGGPEGMPVKRNGAADVAENVEAGDTVCVMGSFSPTVTEVGRTEVNDDGSRGARTVISGGA